MKIGSKINQNFMKINVHNISEQNDNTQDQPQEVKAEEETPEPQTNQISIRARPVNMMAGNFVHSDDSDNADNYSRLNLKGIKSSQSLMTKYNSFIVDLVYERMAYTDDLIESGAPPIDAKNAAAGEFEKRGMDAHKKLRDDINKEELEKQAKESKEFNEKHTEEVIENKQEQKAEETKEAVEKKEEEIKERKVEHSSASIENASANEEVHDDAVTVTASGEVIVTGFEEPTLASTGGKQIIKGAATGKNVDEWI